MPFAVGVAGRILLLAYVIVPSITRQNVAHPPRRYAVVIVLDGARPEYFNLTAMPLILSGPGIKQGVSSNYPARLVDIAPTIERLLRTRSGPVDGVVLQDALTQASSNGARAQRLRGGTFLPVGAALKHRSGYR